MSNAKTKLGITKYSIVTNSNDSVTLRLMTEHDLAMLYEWLNRSHIVEWWGGEEARPTLADVQEQYLPSVLAQESVTPYIAMLNGEPIGYAQSYAARRAHPTPTTDSAWTAPARCHYWPTARASCVGSSSTLVAVDNLPALSALARRTTIKQPLPQRRRVSIFSSLQPLVVINPHRV